MSMEAVHDPDQSSLSWVARLVEVLQPLSLRADRLAGMPLFARLRWSDLEFAAAIREARRAGAVPKSANAGA